MFYCLKQPLLFILLFFCSFTAQSQVAPLLKTQWGQKAPYNDQCPLFGSEQCLAGCLPLAIAQIVNYHKYPQTGMETVTYKPQELPYDITVNFADQQYTWENQTDADIAKLVYHCGVLEQAQYTRSGTNAGRESILALKKHFGYSHKMHAEYHELFTDDEWFALIKHELDAGRPVLYLGENKNGTSGHAWVCDGYNTAGQLHFNFGWNGDEDGYYNIGDITPKSYNFSYRNAVWIGIEPETAQIRGVNFYVHEQNPFQSYKAKNGIPDDAPIPNKPFSITVGFSNNGVSDYGSGKGSEVRVSCYIDGKYLFRKTLSTVPAEIDSLYPTKQEFTLDKIAEGKHTWRIEIDAENQMDEMDETDNVYEWDFIVAGKDQLPNLTIGSRGRNKPVIHFSDLSRTEPEVNYYPRSFFDSVWVSFTILNISKYGTDSAFTVAVWCEDSLKYCEQFNGLGSKEVLHIDSVFLGNCTESAGTYTKVKILVNPSGYSLSGNRALAESNTLDNGEFVNLGIDNPIAQSMCAFAKGGECPNVGCSITLNDIWDSVCYNVYMGDLCIINDTLKERLRVFDTLFFFPSCQPDTLQMRTEVRFIVDGVLMPPHISKTSYEAISGESQIEYYDTAYAYFQESGVREMFVMDDRNNKWLKENNGFDDYCGVADSWFSPNEDTAYIQWYYRPEPVYINGCAELQFIMPDSYRYLQFQGDTTFCSADLVKVTCLLSDAEWSTGERERFITVGPGTYFCRGIMNGDSVYSDTLVLKDWREKNIQITQSKSFICSGDTILLLASEPVIWNDSLESTERFVTNSGTYTYQYSDAFCGIMEGSVSLSTREHRNTRIRPLPSEDCQTSGVKLKTQNTARWSTGDIADTIFVSEPGEYTAVLVADEFCAIESDGFIVPELPIVPEIIHVESGLSVIVPDGTKVTWFANNKQLKAAPENVEPALYEIVCVDQFGCISSDQYDIAETAVIKQFNHEQLQVTIVGQFAKITVPQGKTPASYQVCSLSGAVLHHGTCSGQTFVVKHAPGAIISVTYTDGSKEAVLLPGN